VSRQRRTAFAPLAPERTVERRIARELRESILDGRLGPGTRLPYRDLATQFDVSVTPVRVALHELVTEGLVELRPHSGASVTPLSLEELEELFAMRLGVESWLARLGADRVDDADVAAMRARFGKMEAAAGRRDRARYLREALEYRSLCYRAAGRPRLYATARQLFERSGRYMALSIAKDYRFDQSLEYMREFGVLCASGDGLGAQTLLREALESTMDYVSESLRESLEAP
jgi:DNA-binding GntR family transcriptional regulator